MLNVCGTWKPPALVHPYHCGRVRPQVQMALHIRLPSEERSINFVALGLNPLVHLAFWTVYETDSANLKSVGYSLYAPVTVEENFPMTMLVDILGSLPIARGAEQ